MIAAVSTACLFPKPTEDALYDLCLHGIQNVEIFLNAPSECRTVFAGDLQALLKRFGIRCVSVHPWTAPEEGFMLFSNYPRRCTDFLDEAKHVFELMQRIGAEYYILHGANPGRVSPEIYCERFHLLCEAAKPFGVTLMRRCVPSGKISCMCTSVTTVRSATACASERDAFRSRRFFLH